MFDIQLIEGVRKKMLAFTSFNRVGMCHSFYTIDGGQYMRPQDVFVYLFYLLR